MRGHLSRVASVPAHCTAEYDNAVGLPGTGLTALNESGVAEESFMTCLQMTRAWKEMGRAVRASRIHIELHSKIFTCLRTTRLPAAAGLSPIQVSAD